MKRFHLTYVYVFIFLMKILDSIFTSFIIRHFAIREIHAKYTRNLNKIDFFKEHPSLITGRVLIENFCFYVILRDGGGYFFFFSVLNYGIYISERELWLEIFNIEQSTLGYF